jgi:hypothetical protein
MHFLDLEIILVNYNRFGEVFSRSDGDLVDDNVISFKDYADWKRTPMHSDSSPLAAGVQVS